MFTKFTTCIKRLFKTDLGDPHEFVLIIGSYQQKNPGPFASGHCLALNFSPCETIETFDLSNNLEMDINITNQSSTNMQSTLLQMKSAMNEVTKSIVPSMSQCHVGDFRSTPEKLVIYCSQSPLVHQLRGEWIIADEVIDGYIADVHELAKNFRHGVRFEFVNSVDNPVQSRCKSNFKDYFSKPKKRKVVAQCFDCEKDFPTSEVFSSDGEFFRCEECEEVHHIGRP